MSKLLWTQDSNVLMILSYRIRIFISVETSTTLSPSIIWQISNPLAVDAGWHNWRSFLAANSTQNHFLIAHVKLFVTFATKVCLWHFATKYYNFWYRKSTEREEIKRKWGNLESEFLSTSSFSLHFLFIFSFSLHFLEGRRATQVRDNHNKFRSILNNRKDKHQRYRWEMHITQWRQSTCLRNPWVISVTAHKSCVCVFVTDC